LRRDQTVSRLRTMVSLAAVVSAATACTSHSPRPTATPLRVVPTTTPRFAVGYYDASGVFPQVRARGRDLGAVNAGLRRAILDDQRRYVRGMGRAVNLTFGGIYSTAIDPRLISASTTVVSAMVPALELYPGGNDGSGWVSATVRVPSGRRVQLADLFSEGDLRAFAREWRLRFSHTRQGALLRSYPTDFRDAVFRHAFFALTSNGLAAGFWQDGPTIRLQAKVPYDAIRKRLSPLGARLVAGVRAPTYAGKPPHVSFPGAAARPAKMHTFFRAGAISCELGDHAPGGLGTFLYCLSGSRPSRAISVELHPSGKLTVCHGEHCMSNGPEDQKELGFGEWVESNHFFCLALRRGVRCVDDFGLADQGRGFVLTASGLQQLCAYRPCKRRILPP
jgi:hypothetical protein